MEKISDFLKDKLKLLPNKPGVYIMKDSNDNIIYVGKAIILKNRVRSYFLKTAQNSPKVQVLVSKIVDFEYIVTANELEALVLECNLIKKYRPRYNIMLKDDKTYPYLKLTMQEDFPRLYPTRRLVKDGAKYFGPYASAGSMHDTLAFLRKLFPLRTCKKMNAKRPCLEYHIKRCLAPCAGYIGKKEYLKLVEGVNLFLQGRSNMLLKQLQDEMKIAAEEFRYEQAAILRDQIKSLKTIQQQQTATTVAGDVDVMGLAIDEFGICVQVFFVRLGKIVGRDHFLLQGEASEQASDVLRAFIEQYYFKATFVPKQIVLPTYLKKADQDLLTNWLSDLKKQTVEIVYPKRGVKHDLLTMANENAKTLLAQESQQKEQINAKNMQAVEILAEKIGLKMTPERIDCFDISHIQGSHTVASMVVFKKGMPSKKDYRRYKINSTEGSPDDFKSMQEVVLRRYQKYEDLPELIIIDGGKGQLSSALEVVRGLGLETMVIGLAKQFEEIFKEGEKQSIILDKNSSALFLLQRIRDEAHRFAITYHRKLRSKKSFVSILDNIPGIGEARRKALWEKFSSIDEIKKASIEELLEIRGMNRKVAEGIQRYFLLNNEGF